ncbi:MAG: HAMP domain-containing histidine kinase [Clostridia bacterium]|nr:HAMP domain-containing histidine kinase [Clostridia bacterium]
MLPWIICAVLFIVCVILAVKIYAMKKSISEICDDVTEILSKQTNMKISVTSKDKYVRRLATELSAELDELKKQRIKYQKGDRELKEAITNISHDLRTPLTAVFGYLDLLDTQEVSDDARRYIGAIRGRAEKMKELTEALFRYSVLCSAEELSFEEADVRAILQESVLSFYSEFERRGITPRIKMSETEVIRRVDVSALSRVFDNIISNAVKYGDGDLNIELTGDCRVTFSNKANELSSVDVQRLFDRFFTLNTARRSTGLGLSIAKVLTEKMNGNIEAEYKDESLFITVILE